MEVFKLDSSFNPSTPVTKFDSLIWTERFAEAGDFVITATDDISILTLLPTGTFISHTDTKEVMVVENHQITRQKDKKLKITVTGRSGEVISENRTVLGTDIQLINSVTNQRNETLLTGAPEDIVVLLLQRGLETGFVLFAGDNIANVHIRKDVVTLDSSRQISVPRGDVYSVILPMLKTADAGLKTERPFGSQTTFDIVVHDGINRTGTVIFYAQQEDLVDATYFWSIKDYKNRAVVNTKSAWRSVQDRNIVPTLTGLDRRSMYVEAADIEGTFSSPSSTDALASRGQLAIDRQRKLQLLSATISESAGPRFKINYDVGDLVTVFGEFSVSSTMRVTEHILTSDDTGIHGYPSLSAI